MNEHVQNEPTDQNPVMFRRSVSRQTGLVRMIPVVGKQEEITLREFLDAFDLWDLVQEAEPEKKRVGHLAAVPGRSLNSPSRRAEQEVRVAPAVPFVAPNSSLPTLPEDSDSADEEAESASSAAPPGKSASSLTSQEQATDDSQTSLRILPSHATIAALVSPASTLPTVVRAYAPNIYPSPPVQTKTGIAPSRLEEEQPKKSAHGESLWSSVRGALAERRSRPDWKNDDDAKACDADQCISGPFNWFNRRHHCRACGGVFCGACSSSRVALPQYGYDPSQLQRVCDACAAREGTDAVMTVMTYLQPVRD